MRLGALIVVCGVISCSVGPREGKTQEFHESLATTKVFFEEKCVINNDLKAPKSTPQEFGPIASLLASLAPSLVEKATEFAANWLERRAKKYSATATAEGSARLVLPGKWDSADKSGIGCLIVVSGSFVPDPKPSGAFNKPWDTNNLKTLQLNTEPGFYGEFWMYQYGPTQVILEPVYLFYKDRFSEKLGRGATKDLLITAAFIAQVPDEKKEELAERTLLTYAFYLPKTKVRTRLDRATLSGVGSKALVLVKPGSKPAEKTAKTNGAPSLPGDTAESSVVFTNVRVTILETEGGGDLLLAFSNYIKANKDTINENILKQLQAVLGEE